MYNLLTMTSVTITPRTGKKESVEAIRMDGRIPAVMYGSKFESLPITVSALEFKKAFESAGESTVITLTGGAEDEQALIHEVQYDPVTDRPIHIDFYVVEKGQKVTVHVPLEFEGVSPAVKDLAATLIKVLHEIEVEAEPAKLPHGLTVDISALATMDSQILAKDIKLPEGVTLITGPEEVIASVAEAMKEPEEPVSMDISQIEVEKKGKIEEEGAEGAGDAAAPKADKGEEK